MNDEEYGIEPCPACGMPLGPGTGATAHIGDRFVRHCLTCPPRPFTPAEKASHELYTKVSNGFQRAVKQVVELRDEREAAVKALSQFFDYTPTGQSDFMNAWGWYNAQRMLSLVLHQEGVLDDWEFKALDDKLTAQRPNFRWSDHNGWDAKLKAVTYDGRRGWRKLHVTEFNRD
jgi:hypothetical protein